MGAAEIIQEQRKKIDDSQRMCGSSDAEYDTCWSRHCSPNRSCVLKDVFKGFLVLLGLAVVITVIFLLCYFLLNDFEKKEEEAVDNLIKDFASFGEPQLGSPGNHQGVSEYSTDSGTPNSAKDRFRNVGDAGLTVDVLSRVGDTVGRLEVNEVEDIVTPVSEGAKDRLFDVDEPRPTFEAVDSIPFRVTSDSEISNPSSSLLDAFIPTDETEEPTYDVITEFLGASQNGGECALLRLPLCSGTMPWALTAFPNFVNNNNLDQLHESVKYFQSTIVGSRCSPRAVEYTCAILEPSCGPDSLPLPPCRAFCQDILNTCSEFLVNENEHNSAFICSRFPDSHDPNVCVNINQAPQNITSHHSSDFGSKLLSQNSQHVLDFNRISNTTDRPETTSFSEILQKEKAHPNDSPLPESIPEVTETNEQPQVEIEETNIDTNPTQNSPENQIRPKESVNEEELVRESINVDFVRSQNITETPEYLICDNSKFLCQDGSDCLDLEAVCDGVQHCLDNSDEQNCTKPEDVTTTPLGLFDNEDTQGQESTTELIFISQDNALEDFEAPKRFSLSDMLSGSAIVANPKVTIINPPNSPQKSLRFRTRESIPGSKLNKGKALNSSQNLDKNTLSSGSTPSPTKASDLAERNLEKEATSTKLSLAGLLSSSSISNVTPQTSVEKKSSPSTPQKNIRRVSLSKGGLRPLLDVIPRTPPTKPSPRLTSKVRPRPLLRKANRRPAFTKPIPRSTLSKITPLPTLTEFSPGLTQTKPTSPPTSITTAATIDSTTSDPPAGEPVDAPVAVPSGRSLSALLSSALPSFSSTSRHSSGKCKELKCLDGTCISMSQLGDGIMDCPDGSDEKQGNHIFLK